MKYSPFMEVLLKATAVFVAFNKTFIYQYKMQISTPHPPWGCLKMLHRDVMNCDASVSFENLTDTQSGAYRSPLNPITRTVSLTLSIPYDLVK